MGENGGGQLGIGNLTQQTAPTLVPGIVDVTGLSLGVDATLGGHSCVVLAGGVLRCFGANTRGELGTGDKVNQSTPQTINVAPVAEVALGLQFTCVRLVSGPVRCWGRNDLGQLGTGTKGADQTAPMPLVFP
jgi:alpha-tubulin suppressor-like RCC1 family protein